MISDKMATSINFQINREIFSSYLYLSMASYAESIGLKGTANWFGVQVEEELAHARILYNYMSQQGARVILDAIEAPKNDFTSVRNLFKHTLEHEQKVTGLIHSLSALARTENDFATENFLEWFIKEQVEEEANASGLLQKLDTFGDAGQALLAFDSELALRVFTVPSLLQVK
ncbi:ferritin [bacterium]